MFALLGKVIGTVLGMGGNNTVGSSVVGLANHAVMLPAIYYFAEHYNQIYTVDMPLWNIACILGAVYLAVEYFRRRTGAGG